MNPGWAMIYEVHLYEVIDLFRIQYIGWVFWKTEGLGNTGGELTVAKC